MWDSANDKPSFQIFHNKPLLGIVYDLALPHYLPENVDTTMQNHQVFINESYVGIPAGNLTWMILFPLMDDFAVFTSTSDGFLPFYPGGTLW